MTIASYVDIDSLLV